MLPSFLLDFRREKEENMPMIRWRIITVHWFPVMPLLTISLHDRP